MGALEIILISVNVLVLAVLLYFNYKVITKLSTFLEKCFSIIYQLSRQTGERADGRAVVEGKQVGEQASKVHNNIIITENPGSQKKNPPKQFPKGSAWEKELILYNKIMNREIDPPAYVFWAAIEFKSGINALTNETAIVESSDGEFMIIRSESNEFFLFPYKNSLNTIDSQFFDGPSRFNQVVRPALCKTHNRKYYCINKGEVGN